MENGPNLRFKITVAKVVFVHDFKTSEKLNCDSFHFSFSYIRAAMNKAFQIATLVVFHGEIEVLFALKPAEKFHKVLGVL